MGKTIKNIKIWSFILIIIQLVIIAAFLCSLF